VRLQFRKGLTPRPGSQQSALNQLAATEAKYVLLSAPVGSGKSLIAEAAARGEGSAYIVAPLNTLLEQYQKSFPDVPMVQGRSHYKCSWAGGRWSCDDASERYEAEHTRNCQDYIPARNDFWGASISVTNLHYACFARCPDEFHPHRRLLVVDECHALEPMLLSLFHIHVFRRDCEMLGIAFGQSSVPQLFEDYMSRARGTEEELRVLLPDIKQRDRIKSTARRLAALGGQDAANPWHIERDRDEVRCRPLFARKMGQQLFRKADRFLFMSGTPGNADKFFRNLGIEPGEDTAVIEVDSDIPKGHGVELVKNAPFVTSANLGTVLPILADCCAQAMRESPSDKGLILCASYALQKDLVTALTPEFGRRLIVSTSPTRTQAMEAQKYGSGPTVLIAVNMHEGLDLPDECARFLVIPKVLYTARDSWTMSRDKLDPGYYGRLTTQRMVQACGRVVRGPKDWAHIYILDANFRGLMRRYPEEFPPYFHRGFHAE
jgi:Rad3-related DNA helicase